MVPDLLVCRGVGHALGHDERHIGTRLRQRIQHQPERLFQDQFNGLVIDCAQIGSVFHQHLAHAVFFPPSFERSHSICSGHGCTVVEHQSVAQSHGVGELVVTHRIILHHLRLNVQFAVECKQGVVHHVPVVAGHVGSGPDRVNDLQVRVHHHSEGGLCRHWIHGEQRRAKRKCNGKDRGFFEHDHTPC